MVVKIAVLFLGIMLLIACGSSRKVRMDHTTNRSRVETPTSSATAGRNKTAEPTVIGRPRHEVTGEGTEADNLPNPVTATAPLAMADRLVLEAEQLVGVRYQYAGNSPSRGFDCSGLTCYVFEKQGIDLPRTSTDQSKLGTQIPFDKAEVGDLVFFGTGKRVTHVALVVGRGRRSMEVVHSTSSKGVIREEILGSPYWSSRKLWAVNLGRLR